MQLPAFHSQLDPILQKELITATTNLLATEPAHVVISENPVRGFLPLPSGAPYLLGMSGKPKTGKDSSADYLASQYKNIEVVQISSFILQEVNTWLQDHAADYCFDEVNKSLPAYRQFLQVYSRSRLSLDPDYWVNRVRAHVTEFMIKQEGCLILTGVRTPADIDLVRYYGGEVWRVIRPSNPYTALDPIENMLDQTPLTSYDLLVYRDGPDKKSFYQAAQVGFNLPRYQRRFGRAVHAMDIRLS